MKVDYATECVNFRDVGEFIDLIAGREILAEGKLYRGGSTDFVGTLEELCCPKTIINLRNGHDLNVWKVNYHHFSISKKVEKYDTYLREVKRWLISIINLLNDENMQFPVLIHCLSGKDRTGVVVAAILSSLLINKDWIVEEYLLSEGKVDRKWIELTLSGLDEWSSFLTKASPTNLSNQLLTRNMIK